MVDLRRALFDSIDIYKIGFVAPPFLVLQIALLVRVLILLRAGIKQPATA